MVVLAIAAFAGWYWISNAGRESTDDAFVDCEVHRVMPKVAGRVVAVHVADNQDVEAGALIAEIDPREYRFAVDAARAASALAEAQLQAALVEVDWTTASTASAATRARADLAAADARLLQERAAVDAARAESERADADRDRYAKLSDRAVSAQTLDRIRQTATAAEADLRTATTRAGSAEAEVAAANAAVAAADADLKKIDAAKAAVERWRAEVERAKAALGDAELALAETRIVAPAAGRIARKAILAGGFVQPGQMLCAVVSGDVWVVANFKETQLRDLRPGQHATIHVDAFGIDLRGHVDSVQAGTGARFSLLPPENATGNFVKVVQRVPVKIVFDERPDPARWRLGPGMSVVPVIDLR